MRSLRSRLALTIFLIGGVALLAMSVAVMRFVEHDLRGRLDTQLNDVGARFAEGRYRDVLDPGRNLGRVLLPGVVLPEPTGPVDPTHPIGSGASSSDAATSSSNTNTNTSIANPGNSNNNNPNRRGVLGGLGEVYTELRDTNDKLVLTPRVYRLDDATALSLRLPKKLPTPTVLGTTFSVLSSTGEHYRAVYRTVTTSDGRTYRLLTAVRAEGVIETLGRLQLVLAFASLGVLAAIGTAGWFVAKLGLRPLGRIENAAATIAAGDLSHRIDDVDPRSEIGRLGGSLNSMMSQIETAFEERAASEAQLQRFVADASHELRTPLTAIRGHAQLHQRVPGITAETKATLSQIEAASGRMTGIVENLLSLARHGNGASSPGEPIAVGAVVRSVVIDARAMHDGRVIDLLTQTPHDVVLADIDRLHQSVANLVENALRYTKGRVTIATVATTLPCTTAPGTGSGTASVPAIRIDVTDEGPGISAEHLAHIFEPFYRVDPGRARATGGSGLGLAIVHANVAAAGGQTTVVSDPTGGSTFSITLPVALPPTGAEATGDGPLSGG